ncbi:MAG: response regulator, partial [Chloroflexota bacterium]
MTVTKFDFMPDLNHQKRILLIEDQEQFYTPITRWLESRGYHVTHADSFLAAKTAIHTAHFHMAIVDLNLDNDDPDNEAGFELLQEMRNLGLHHFMPCIMLSAYGTMHRTLRAFRDLKVTNFITKEAGFRRELLPAVDEIFKNEIKINFDLEYDEHSAELMSQIADDVNWSMTTKPDTKLLTMQLLDLFGKLFAEAKKIDVSKLKPGLTGAAVIRVQPTWEHGRGTSFVAKVGREDKVRMEAERYEQYVLRYLPPNTIAQVKDVEYSRLIGILLYTFTENDMVPLKEFDEFYTVQSERTIIQSLRNLFETTCLHWYDDSRSQAEEQDLAQLYFDAFRFDERKLIQRIQVVLPEFDPHAPTYQFEQNKIEGINPVYWLNRHQNECMVSIYHSITHGDLTGRNIMVDQTNKCWLIDFFRTYDSH